MAVAFIDPVAQTFFVDAATYPKGMFVHSVDLIFKKKDTTTYQPFSVQLRPTVNGFPHSSLIHSSAALGQVQLRPDKIKTVSGEGPDIPSLDNPNHYTRFVFPAPVFLLPGEHALVLFTNSDDYEVFISEVGGERLDGSNRRVTKQPYTGSFFKSQNGSTYTPFQDLDLMFRLNACNFTQGNRTLVVENAQITSNSEYDIIKVVTQDLTFKDAETNYFFRPTDNLTRTFDSNFVNIIRDSDRRLEARKVVLSGTEKSLQLKVDLTTTDNTVSPLVDTTRLNAVTIKNIINDCGLTEKDFTITNSGSGYTSNATITITSGTGIGATAVGVANLASGQIESIVVTNSGFGYTEDVTATISAPSVPSGNTTATVSVASETNAKGGPALARYITRKVNLSDGFDANTLRVYLTAYQPNQATIEVYYKVHADEDPAIFETRPWVRMLNVQQGNESLLNTIRSQVDGDYLEYLFIPKTDSISYVGENSVTYNTFKTFAIKIVLRTSNTTFSPIVRDLRVLALAP
jgi:hypothetical protein